MIEPDFTELSDEELRNAIAEEQQKHLPIADQPLQPTKDTIESRLASSPDLRILLDESALRRSGEAHRQG